MIEDIRSDLELQVGLPEEVVRRGHCTMADVELAGDIDV